MKYLIASFTLLLFFSNCSNKKNNFETTISSNYNIYKVEVSTNKNYYDSIINCKHSKKCTFYTLRFGCSFAAVNTIKPQLL